MKSQRIQSTMVDSYMYRRVTAVYFSLPFKEIFGSLGPGLITGAADVDPATIGTYSQAGAQFGLGMLWLALFQYPMMAIVQEMCARIGLVTVSGLGAAIREKYSKKNSLNNCKSYSGCKYDKHRHRYWYHGSIDETLGAEDLFIVDEKEHWLALVNLSYVSLLMFILIRRQI